VYVISWQEALLHRKKHHVVNRTRYFLTNIVERCTTGTTRFQLFAWTKPWTQST